VERRRQKERGDAIAKKYARDKWGGAIRQRWGDSWSEIEDLGGVTSLTFDGDLLHTLDLGRHLLNFVGGHDRSVGERGAWTLRRHVGVRKEYKDGVPISFLVASQSAWRAWLPYQGTPQIPGIKMLTATDADIDTHKQGVFTLYGASF